MVEKESNNTNALAFLSQEDNDNSLIDRSYSNDHNKLKSDKRSKSGSGIFSTGTLWISQDTLVHDDYLNILNNLRNPDGVVKNLYSTFIEKKQKQCIDCYNLGTLHQNQIYQAIELLDEGIEVENKNFFAYYNFGCILKDKSEVELAIDYFKKFIELNKGLFLNYLAYYYLGYLLQNQNLDSEALECFYHTIEINKDFSFAHYDIGYLLQKQNNYQEAKIYYKKAMELDRTIMKYKYAYDKILELDEIQGNIVLYVKT